MRLDRYIFVEWLKVFLLSMGVMFGILLVSDIQDNLQDLLGFEADAQTILRFYWIKLPAFLPVALPMSFMLSLLFILGQLHRNLEITALWAAGLGLFRITRSLWAAGFVLTGLFYHLNANLVPRAVEQSRELWNALAFQQALIAQTPVEELGLLYNLTFFNRRDQRMWFINRFSEYDYQAYGITVSEMSGDGGRELTRIVANRGYFDDIRGGWQLESGRVFSFDPSSGDVIRSLPFEQLERMDFGEDPQLMKFLEKSPKDLSMLELRRVVSYLGANDDPRVLPFAVAFYNRLLNPVVCLIILGLAIPSSVTGVRTNPLVGVSKAMGWFVGYLLLVQSGQIAGAGGMDPLLVAAMPNIAALVMVVHYNLRLRKPV